MLFPQWGHILTSMENTRFNNIAQLIRFRSEAAELIDTAELGADPKDATDETSRKMPETAPQESDAHESDEEQNEASTPQPATEKAAIDEQPE